MLDHATDDWNEIIPNLWMGGHDRYYVDSDGIWPLPVHAGSNWDLVISLYRRSGHGPSESVEHYEHLFADGPLSPEDAFEVEHLAGLVAHDVAAGRRVLVRCQAGLNRSGLVVALAMIELGHSPEAAIALIRDRRSPHALFNQHFVRHLTARKHQEGTR